MPAGIPIEKLIEVARAIHELVKKVESNKKQFHTLNQRVTEVVRAVKGLDHLPPGQQFIDSLNRLHATLIKIKNFAEQFANQKWYKQVIKAGNNAKRFESLNADLRQDIDQLNLGITAAQLINQAQDRADQANDQQAITENQARIVRLQQEEKQLLLDMKMAAEDRHRVLAQQMASIQFHLKRARYEARASSPEAHLGIPFHEIDIRQTIGQGALGIVYHGQHAMRDVAVKMIDAGVAEHLAELDREVQIMCRLRSAEIVTLFGVCQEEAATCLVMEYMANGNLYDYLTTHVIDDPNRQKQWIIEMTKGLHFLHSQNVLHRDLKSANVLINADHHVKVSDFGLSQMRTGSIATAHKRSEAMQWMAPEVRRINPVYSKASDVYSLGVIIWEILSNQSPFDTRHRPEVAMQDLRGQPGEIPESTPEIYRRLIEPCWSEDPNERPEDLGEVIRALEAYQPRPPSPSGEANFAQAQHYHKEKNYREAYPAFRRAAEKGVHKAYTYCAMYTLMGGLGGASDDKGQALRQLQIAAEQGHHQRAMYNLARMHEKGDGTPVDLDTALIWYQKATDFDPSMRLTMDAKEKVTRLKEALSQTVKLAR